MCPANHRTPCTYKCLRRGTFCHQRQKVPKERRQNQWFWIPCAGVVQTVSEPFGPANNPVQTRPVLSHCLCVYPPRRAPRLYCPGITGPPLRLPPGAMWASRPTTPIGKPCVGAGFYPARTCTAPLVFPAHLSPFLSHLPHAKAPGPPARRSLISEYTKSLAEFAARRLQALWQKNRRFFASYISSPLAAILT